MDFTRTPAEADAVMNEAAARTADGPSAFPGMTYEEGVRDALAWALDADASNPLED